MTTRDQNIRVIPDTLNNLIVAVSKGQYRIPQFQREFVWPKSKVLELFDSVYKEYPIGSFFLWRAGREQNKLFRHSVALDVPPIRDDDDVSFILDGQQRITSLYVTLKGLTAGATDYSHICLDVKDESFTYREPDGKRYIAVCDIWQESTLKISKGVDESYHGALERCHNVLGTYPISVIEVGAKDLPAVCNIFQRINQSGKRLDRFDLISAMTFSTDFDLRERFKTDIVTPLSARQFGGVAPTIATQLMALIKKGACTESAEFSLTSDDIQEMWKVVVRSILLAADTLRKTVGVKSYGYLPYDAILTLLAYCYAKSGQRSLSEAQMGWIKKWFWRASFALHYGAGGPTKMGQDKLLIDRLIEGELPPFAPALKVSPTALIDIRMTRSGSAIRNAFLCLLAHRDPLHLSNNSKLDLLDGGISDFTNGEKHHIFPRAFLLRQKRQTDDVYALPNFCFLPAELNNRISDSRPSEYFEELARENPSFALAARSHLIPLGKDSGIPQDDYDTFLAARSQAIIEEIERVTGLSSAPSADERHKSVVELETRLRDLIQSTLVKVHGAEYWKRVVPGDIQDEVEKRIAVELRKHPELSPRRYDGAREKLDFCNVPDYLKLIIGKANWPSFEPIFHKQPALQKHMEAFAEFRNAVMHHRELAEVGRLEGETALVWFNAVLTPLASVESDIDDENPDI